MVTETIVWVGRLHQETATCIVAVTCAGVELSILHGTEIVRRERHPDRSTAYERARDLNRAFADRGYVIESKVEEKRRA